VTTFQFCYSSPVSLLALNQPFICSTYNILIPILVFENPRLCDAETVSDTALALSLVLIIIAIIIIIIIIIIIMEGTTSLGTVITFRFQEKR
jgi:hypothetical protein